MKRERTKFTEIKTMKKIFFLLTLIEKKTENVFGNGENYQYYINYRFFFIFIFKFLKII